MAPQVLTWPVTRGRWWGYLVGWSMDMNSAKIQGTSDKRSAIFYDDTIFRIVPLCLKCCPRRVSHPSQLWRLRGLIFWRTPFAAKASASEERKLPLSCQRPHQITWPFWSLMIKPATIAWFWKIAASTMHLI